MEGEYRVFRSIKTQTDERVLFSPLGPGATSPLLSFSFSFSSHPMLSSGWEGERLGDQRRSRQQNTDQQQGGTDAQAT